MVTGPSHVGDLIVVDAHLTAEGTRLWHITGCGEIGAMFAGPGEQLEDHGNVRPAEGS